MSVRTRTSASRRLRWPGLVSASRFLAALACLAVLAGCSTPSLVQVSGFARHTEAMAHAFDATYREALTLLDEAPVTPEIAEVHERLLEEEEALEHSFGPIRKSLDSATEYAASLQSLVHDRNMSSDEAASKLQSSVAGMLGPFGALAPPLAGGGVVGEIGKAFSEIKDIRRIRKANRTLTNALRTLRPAIQHYVAEVRADLQDLHDWTARVIEVLQEQNRSLHADVLTIEASYRAREGEALRVLAYFAQLEQAEIGGIQPRTSTTSYATGKAREAALQDPLDPLRVTSIRFDLERLDSTRTGGAAELDAELTRLGGALRARKVLRSSLDRKGIPDPETEETVKKIAARIDDLLRRTGSYLPTEAHRRTRRDHHLARVAADLGDVATAVLQLVQELLEGLTRAIGSGARPPPPRCGDVLLLSELARVFRALDAALEGASGAEALRQRHLTTVLSNIFDAEAAVVIRDLRGEAAWLKLLAEIPPGRSHSLAAAPPALEGACRQGLGEDLDLAAARTHLAELWLSYRGSAEIGRRAGEVERALYVLEMKTRPVGHHISAEAAPVLAGIDDAVSRLWEAATAAGALADLDPVLGQKPIPSAGLLEQREQFWRQKVVSLREEKELIADDLVAFEERQASLAASGKRLHGLLAKGEAAIRAWEDTHLGLDASVRVAAGAKPLDLLAGAVEDHHEALGLRPVVRH